MNRFIKYVLILSIVSLSFIAPIESVYAQENSFINEGGVSFAQLPEKVEGKVSISGETSKQKIKVLVIKDTYQEWFDISLNKGKFNKDIWLIEGKGTYEITIMINLEGRKYSYGPTTKVENTVEVNRFLVPVKDVESDDKTIGNLAKRLTQFSKSDRDRAKNLYNWLIRNIKYDYDKYKRQLASDYSDVYGALNTIKTKKGVCYDYATLLAAMGRSLGMQVKVVRGDFKSGKRLEYHAWNEVYLSDEDKWINIDATFGYALNKNYFDNDDFEKDHIKIDEF